MQSEKNNNLKNNFFEIVQISSVEELDASNRIVSFIDDVKERKALEYANLIRISNPAVKFFKIALVKEKKLVFVTDKKISTVFFNTYLTARKKTNKETASNVISKGLTKLNGELEKKTLYESNKNMISIAAFTRALTNYLENLRLEEVDAKRNLLAVVSNMYNKGPVARIDVEITERMQPSASSKNMKKIKVVHVFITDESDAVNHFYLDMNGKILFKSSMCKEEKRIFNASWFELKKLAIIHACYMKMINSISTIYDDDIVFKNFECKINFSIMPKMGFCKIQTGNDMVAFYYSPAENKYFFSHDKKNYTLDREVMEKFFESFFVNVTTFPQAFQNAVNNIMPKIKVPWWYISN